MTVATVCGRSASRGPRERASIRATISWGSRMRGVGRLLVRTNPVSGTLTSGSAARTIVRNPRTMLNRRA